MKAELCYNQPRANMGWPELPVAVYNISKLIIKYIPPDLISTVLRVMSYLLLLSFSLLKTQILVLVTN